MWPGEVWWTRHGGPAGDIAVWGSAQTTAMVGRQGTPGGPRILFPLQSCSAAVHHCLLSIPHWFRPSSVCIAAGAATVRVSWRQTHHRHRRHCQGHQCCITTSRSKHPTPATPAYLIQLPASLILSIPDIIFSFQILLLWLIKAFVITFIPKRND